jgi:hypothetical protein
MLVLKSDRKYSLGLSIALIVTAQFALLADGGVIGAPQILLDKLGEPSPACDGNEVLYTYFVSNTGNVALANVVVVDDNATANTDDDFSPNFDGGDDNPNGLLDLNETWVYSHSTTLPIGTHTNNAVASGIFDTTTVTSQDDETIVVFGNPVCTITAEAPCPGSTDNTACVPNAGDGAFYDWSITGGTITSGAPTNPCITYDAGPGGTVHLSVTVTSGEGCSCEMSVDLSRDCGGGGGTQGCGTGYWKNHTRFWDAGCPGEDPAADATATIQTCDLFNATFGVTSTQSGMPDTATLLDALKVGKGDPHNPCNRFALARHLTAALVNADAVDAPHTTTELIGLYQDAVGAVAGDGTVCSLLERLTTDAPELECPCNDGGCDTETGELAAVQTVGGSNNAMCGLGVGMMMPLGLAGWALARRRR